MVSAATRLECEARGRICRNFDWRVDGQMLMFVVVMCRVIEKLHGDMSYVLIGGSKFYFFGGKHDDFRVLESLDYVDEDVKIKYKDVK
nr:hypothetical protein CFP56_15324 [Quercus suber]